MASGLRFLIFCASVTFIISLSIHALDAQTVKNVTMCWMGGPYTDAELSCLDEPGTEIYILGGIYYLSTCDVSAGCCLGPTDCCEYPPPEGNMWDAEWFCHGYDWCELSIAEPMEIWTTCYNNAMVKNYLQEIFYTCVSPGTTPTVVHDVPARCIIPTAAPITTVAGTATASTAAATTTTAGITTFTTTSASTTATTSTAATTAALTTSAPTTTTAAVTTAATTTGTTATVTTTASTTTRHPEPTYPDNLATTISFTFFTELLSILVAMAFTNGE